MPPPPRPRTSSGRPSGPTPMSERQQMALLMQMTSTSSEAELSPNSQSNRQRDRNERGETPLHIAAKKGDLEAAKKLLEQGTNPNVTDFAGWTPLHEASNHGHYHVAQMLVKHGANVMATGLDDITPLHDAASFGNQKLVKFLIDKGADPNFKNKKGKTPQDIAHASLMGFFSNLMGEMANNKQQQQQQNSQKKADLKKSNTDEDPSAIQNAAQAPASDVYEFVSTPTHTHSSCSSGDENPIKFDKSSLDDKFHSDSDTPITSNTASTSSSAQQQKRALGDQQDRIDDNLSPADDDSKRKKRKDSEFSSSTSASSSSGGVGKDGKTSLSGGTNRVTSRVGQKPPGPASKTMGLISKGGDRKSPCESPKMPTKSPADTADLDNEEGNKASADGGPKVPPLKIVIPPQQQQQQQPQQNQQAQQQQTQQQNLQGGADQSQEQQQGTNNHRTSVKSGASRNTANIPSSSSSLPYVLNANSNDSNSNSNDKQETSTTLSAGQGNVGRSQSPSADSNKSNGEDGKPTTGSGKSNEPRKLRSSQRGGKDDRSSNNSSPQLPVSSASSPAAQNSGDSSSAGTESEGNGQATNAATSTSTSTANTSNQPSTSGSTSQASQQQSQNQQQPQASSSSSSSSSSSQTPVELHPRKRKIKTSSNKEQPAASSSSINNTNTAAPSTSSTIDTKDSNSKDGSDKAQTGDVHPHDQPFTNCYQMYIDLRKQIDQRHRNLHPIEPRPLKGLEDYLMNRRTYSLQNKTSLEPNIIIPPLLPNPMKETFVEQEKERHKLKMKHIVEKEKLVLSKEQEILRVHCKAAQMIANQAVPFSTCTILKDEEVYNIITPEQEEKYRNKNRERSHGRVFYQALKELDDKWDKIKEAMIIRHTNEAESLHAVQKMNYGWKLKELSLCDYKTTPEIEELHVPMVDVSDEYTTPSTSD